MGDFYSLGMEFFFANVFLVIEFFFPDIQSHCMVGISLQDIFFRSKSACRIFFLKSPIFPPPALKSEMVGPLP